MVNVEVMVLYYGVGFVNMLFVGFQIYVIEIGMLQMVLVWWFDFIFLVYVFGCYYVVFFVDLNWVIFEKEL